MIETSKFDIRFHAKLTLCILHSKNIVTIKKKSIGENKSQSRTRKSEIISSSSSSSSSSMYFPLLPSIFTKVNLKNKEGGRSGTTGKGVS